VSGEQVYPEFNETEREKMDFALEYGLDNNEFLYVYIGIVGLLCLASLVRSIGFFWICMKASVNLHSRMFSSVLRSPIKFFDDNPSGKFLFFSQQNILRSSYYIRLIRIYGTVDNLPQLCFRSNYKSVQQRYWGSR
jgi:hypothetical protein